MKNHFIYIIIFTILFFLFPGHISAGDITCQNRYLTLVNPVRGRTLWSDKTLSPIMEQSASAKKYNFPVTWLVQYDALTDKDIVNELKKNGNDEIGLFLEVSKHLADDAKVIYPDNKKWSDPGVVFLSAYSQSERRRIIDLLYGQFKNIMGYYPKSVGAWWIDSYSLNYIKQKYGLSAVLIVADQKTTDSYGVWGQWWGYPYYPSMNNVLIPADKNKLDAVVIQWAQRDPVLAYGSGPSYSNFSLQANDYIRNGKKTDYFKDLSSLYLSCNNPLGQITIGMETGMEGSAFQGEYDKQLLYLSGVPNLKADTMSEFSTDFKKVYGSGPNKANIGGWNLNIDKRENTALGDEVDYDQNVSFSDYFLADKNSFLNRSLPIDIHPRSKYIPWLLILIPILAGLSIWKKKLNIFLVTTLFCLGCFGLFFRSGVYMGWQVFYGPVLGNLVLFQIAILFLVFTSIWYFYIKFKRKIPEINLFLWLLPLSFGIDTILDMIRISNISGGYFLGILIAKTRLTGFTISNTGILFLDKILPVNVSESFLKIPFEKIWPNPVLYFIFYPLIHILLALMLYLIQGKVSSKARNVLIFFLVILFILRVVWVFGCDPREVFPSVN